MPKSLYVGENGIAKKVTGMYVGVNGVARKVVKAYIGDEDGIAKEFYPGVVVSTGGKCLRNNDAIICDIVLSDDVLSQDRFYLNNSNAPVIDGYDFVMAIPNDILMSELDLNELRIYYVPNTVPDRTKTEWMDTSWYTDSSVTDLYMTDSVNTYSAVSVKNMFSILRDITTAPKMNTSNVTDMGRMFFNCRSLTTVPEFDTSSVTNMKYMFYSCRSLTTVPEFDTSSVTDMFGMFYGCSSLTTIPEFDTSNATDMIRMFYDCSSLTTIPWEIDMSSCISCDDMFTNCPATDIKLKNVPTSLSHELSYIGTTNYTVVNYI